MKKFAPKLFNYFMESPWVFIGKNYNADTTPILQNLIEPTQYIRVYKNTEEYGLYCIQLGDNTSLIIDSDFHCPIRIGFGERDYIQHKSGQGCTVISEVCDRWVLKFIYGDKVLLNDKVIHNEKIQSL